MSARAVAIDDACAGMVLAAPLLDAHGGLLLPAGTALTGASLASLRRRGIEQCSIIGAAQDDGAADPAALARQRERTVLRLTQLFRHSADNEASAALLQKLTDYRMRGNS